MSTARRRLLVLAREPVAGRVKTRLIPSLGEAGAAALYERLLDGTLAAAAGIQDADLELWYEAGNADPRKCRTLADRYGMPLHRQQGRDLGNRMYHAIAGMPQASGQLTVLIGSDCPDYTADYLSSAFAALQNHDAVLGPAMDGGYVLIGLNRNEPRLFEGIRWGGQDVLQITRVRLVELNWRWAELPALRDIDRPSDLAHFPELSAACRVG